MLMTLKLSAVTDVAASLSDEMDRLKHKVLKATTDTYRIGEAQHAMENDLMPLQRLSSVVDEVSAGLITLEGQLSRHSIEIDDLRSLSSRVKLERLISEKLEGLMLAEMSAQTLSLTAQAEGRDNRGADNFDAQQLATARFESARVDRLLDELAAVRAEVSEQQGSVLQLGRLVEDMRSNRESTIVAKKHNSLDHLKHVDETALILSREMQVNANSMIAEVFYSRRLGRLAVGCHGFSPARRQS